MSRYQLECDRYQITVGWDNPLRTYFAIVEDPTVEDDDESILLWIGDDYEEIKSLDELKEKIANYVSLNALISQKFKF